VIAESTALTNEPAFRNVFSYALMRDEKGEEMHKSKGNAIWFEDAADTMGVDTMRWLFSTVNPSQNVNFGYHVADEVRRRFILPLWNSYSFFATYARLDGFDPGDVASQVPVAERTLLDRWIISRLNQVIVHVRRELDAFHPDQAANEIERFVVEELSNWYIRRNRRRFWKSESDLDKAAAYQTLYECLVALAKLLTPFTPFLSETMYQNLVRSIDPSAPESVHLADYPAADPNLIDEALSRDMGAVLEVVKLGRAARSEAGVKTRQPLPAVLVYSRDPGVMEAVVRLKDQILDELNVKDVAPLVELGDVVAYNIRPKLNALGPRFGKKLGELRQLLAAEDPVSVAERANAGAPVMLMFADGSSAELGPDDLLIDLTKRAGYAAAQGAIGTVVLDTALTPDLIQEGLARDFVRGVQDGRKNAGYRIEDRIVVRAVADPEAIAALEANRDYVMTETLANVIEFSSTTGASDQVESTLSDQPGATDVFEDQVEAGGHQIQIKLQRS